MNTKEVEEKKCRTKDKKEHNEGEKNKGPYYRNSSLKTSQPQ